MLVGSVQSSQVTWEFQATFVTSAVCLDWTFSRRPRAEEQEGKRKNERAAATERTNRNETKHHQIRSDRELYLVFEGLFFGEEGGRCWRGMCTRREYGKESQERVHVQYSTVDVQVQYSTAVQPSPAEDKTEKVGRRRSDNRNRVSPPHSPTCHLPSVAHWHIGTNPPHTSARHITPHHTERSRTVNHIQQRAPPPPPQPPPPPPPQL